MFKMDDLVGRNFNYVEDFELSVAGRLEIGDGLGMDNEEGVEIQM